MYTFHSVRCATCKEEKKLKLCGTCHRVSYCSIACQKEHWVVKHKTECLGLKRIFELIQFLKSETDIETILFGLSGMKGDITVTLSEDEKGIHALFTDRIWNQEPKTKNHVSKALIRYCQNGKLACETIIDLFYSDKAIEIFQTIYYEKVKDRNFSYNFLNGSVKISIY